MIKTKKLFLLFLLLFPLLQEFISGYPDKQKPLELYKQTIYTSQDGLPQNSVFDIVQTPDGFIWLGTDLGISRFDGVKFDVFNKEDAPALSDDIIKKLLVDSTGVLWISTEHGGVMSYEKGVFKRKYTTENGLLNNSTSAISESHDGSLWFGTAGGLNHLQKGELYTVPFPEIAVSKNVQALVEDASGQLWIGTTDGLLKLIRKGKKYRVMHAGLNSYYITDLVIDRENRLWVGTNGNGLIRMQEQGNRQFAFTTENGLSSNQVDSLYADQDGSILIASRGGGLNRLQGNKVSVFGISEGLSHNYVSAVFRDRERNIWVGTNGGGVTLLSYTKIITYHAKNGLSYDQVYGIYQDSRGYIWVGTFGFGVNCIKDGRIIKQYTEQDGLPSNFIISLCEDPEGNIWFGTYGAGAVRMKNGHFETFSKESGLINNFVYGLYVTRRGELWAGTNQGGLHRFSNGRFKLYQRLEGKVRAFLEDSQGNLWVGTDTVGLVRVKEEEMDTFNTSRGLSSNDIMSLFEDKTGVIWVTTFGGGVNRYGKETGRFEAIGRKNGLPHDIIFQILEDDRDFLWMSSMEGIFRVSRKELDDFFNGESASVSGTTFAEADGMKVRECNGGTQPSGWRTGDGRLWFITAAGVSVIDPADTRTNTPAPPAAIKQITIDGKPYNPLRRKLEAPPGKGNIEIKYTGLSFVAPERVQFKYKLEGYDEGWIDAKNRRQAFYTNIPHGSYTFSVYACSHEGTWNEKGASFELIIDPYFWETWWFKLPAIFFVLFLILSLYMAKIKSIKRKQQALEELVTERTRNLKQKKVELEAKQAALQKINHVVKSINAAVDYKDILNSILKETAVLEGSERALALVYDKSIAAYSFKASLGCDVNRLKHIRLSSEEAEGRYIKDAVEIYTDIFIVKNISGRPAEEKIKPLAIPRSMLILKIRADHAAAGFLIFEDMEDEDGFEKRDIQLLKELKDHIAAAFIKSKLLLELEAERETAEAANRSKSMFLARMSHEIRTPMNSVIGFAEMLQDTKLNKDQREFTRNITKSGEVLLNLIDEILDFSKIEAGRLVFQSIEFDLKAIVFDVCRLIKPRLADKPVEILCSISDRTPTYVKGDPGRIRQVLLNLMGNAAKFTHEGEIGLSVDVEEETDKEVKLNIQVRDTGIGIAEDQSERIFEQFQQADGSITNNYGGTGLGLAISKQIALLMRGGIRVKSEEDKGSTFHFFAWVEKSGKKSLPAEDEKARRSKEKGNKWEIENGKNPVHILLVEDNPVNRKLARFMLTKGGYRFDVAINGKEAVNIYTAAPEKFDLIFMDINMPEMDGIKAARIIRERGFVDIPIIAMTAHALKEDRGKCLQAGMNDYISKPIKQEVVFNMIQKWARRTPVREV